MILLVFSLAASADGYGSSYYSFAAVLDGATLPSDAALSVHFEGMAPRVVLRASGGSEVELPSKDAGGLLWFDLPDNLDPNTEQIAVLYGSSSLYSWEEMSYEEIHFFVAEEPSLPLSVPSLSRLSATPWEDVSWSNGCGNESGGYQRNFDARALFEEVSVGSWIQWTDGSGATLLLEPLRSNSVESSMSAVQRYSFIEPELDCVVARLFDPSGAEGISETLCLFDEPDEDTDTGLPDTGDSDKGTSVPQAACGCDVGSAPSGSLLGIFIAWAAQSAARRASRHKPVRHSL